ncbi:MAG: hypothetical protein WAM07_11795 [Halobacillus sp.]
MKKMIAVIGVVAFLASAAAPILSDSAVDAYPRPLVAEVEEV